MMISTVSPRERPAVPGGRLWTGIILAPAAWTLAELIGYVVSARTCDGPAAASGRAAVTQGMLAAGLGLLAVIGLVIAVGNWRRVREAPASSEPPAEGRTHFMAVVGVVGSALFVLGIIYFTLPPFLVDPCHHFG